MAACPSSKSILDDRIRELETILSVRNMKKEMHDAYMLEYTQLLECKRQTETSKIDFKLQDVYLKLEFLKHKWHRANKNSLEVCTEFLLELETLRNQQQENNETNGQLVDEIYAQTGKIRFG